jgi:hypothetical protein
MRIAASIFATLALLAHTSALACSCGSMPPPLPGEKPGAWTARVWSERLKDPQLKNVFFARVKENIGWPLKLAAVEVLAGGAPPGGLVFNQNNCGANAPVGSKIVVRTDDSFQVSMCGVDLLDAEQERGLRKLVGPRDTK